MKYIEIAFKSFKNNLMYRVECISEIINLFVVLIVNISIWKAIYRTEGDLTGVPFRMITTYVFLSLVLFHVFSMDDYYIEKKIRSGGIVFEMLRPTNFTMYVLSYNLGILLYRFIFLFCPILLAGSVVMRFFSPFSTKYFLFFLLSVVFGYFIMYFLNFTIWLCSFWIYRIFSLVTIKDTLLLLLSGAVFPIWMLPEKVQDIISMTPFEAILYIPVSIYLGQITTEEIIFNIEKQVFWLVFFFFLSQLVWKRAKRNFCVQGG